MEYFPWLNDDEDDALAWIDQSPEEIRRKDYLLTTGDRARDWFPDDVMFDLSDDYGIRLADSIPNVLGFLIVSDKLKHILEDQSSTEIEFLPVGIRNQKKRPVDRPYYVANVLGTLACVDIEQSDFTMDAIDKEHVDWFRRLVLDESRIGTNHNIFRLAELPGLILVREDLVDAVLEQDCTGIIFQYLEEYGAEFRD